MNRLVGHFVVEYCGFLTFPRYLFCGTLKIAAVQCALALQLLLFRLSLCGIGFGTAVTETSNQYILVFRVFFLSNSINIDLFMVILLLLLQPNCAAIKEENNRIFYMLHYSQLIFNIFCRKVTLFPYSRISLFTLAWSLNLFFISFVCSVSFFTFIHSLLFIVFIYLFVLGSNGFSRSSISPLGIMNVV